MPVPGVPNNPQGVNGWDGFGTEQPYGEATQQSRLQQAAPLAGGRVAAGAQNAPRRAQRAATRPAPAGQAQPPEGAPPMLPDTTPSYEARLAAQLSTIAQIPGASPLLQEYATLAQGRVAGG